METKPKIVLEVEREEKTVGYFDECCKEQLKRNDYRLIDVLGKAIH